MLEDNMNVILKRINDKMRSRVFSSVKSAGITLEQLVVLTELAQSDKNAFSVKNAQASLQVSQPTATGVVSRLESGGFVRSYQPASDKRVKLIELTEKGKKCADKALKRIKKEQDLLLSCLSDKEQDELQKLLRKAFDSYCKD